MPPDGDNYTKTVHMIKTTKRGKPFLKDAWNLFANFVFSVDLTIHNQLLRKYPNSFTTDDAVQHLSSFKVLKFDHCPDPRDPSRMVTTSTKTTFSMTREMAMALCQHFMDMRVIENAVDSNIDLFKKRGIYQLTPKGLHVLDCFINDNGINTDHLESPFQAQPICSELLHLKRSSDNDEIIILQGVITALFRRFVGRSPNYTNLSHTDDVFTIYNERARSIQLHDYIEKAQPHLDKSQQEHKYCFRGVDALKWLCDFTSIVGQDEAAEIAAQFVRFGFISLVLDKRKKKNSGAQNSIPGINLPQGEFWRTNKATYKITEEGYKVARWDLTQSLNPAFDRSCLDSLGNAMEENGKVHHRVPLVDRVRSGKQAKLQKESNVERLRMILEDTNTRHLFRDFLRAYFCEEDLSFWLDVEDIKRKMSSPVVVTAKSNRGTLDRTTVGSHHASFVNTAFSIYNRYLAPSSQCKLNIDQELRTQLDQYLEVVITHQTVKGFTGRIEPEQVNYINVTQLQALIKLYEHIQSHVFELMATDPIPKFVKTAKYLVMRKRAQILSFEESTISDEADGASMTVSRRAREREHRQQTQGRHFVNT